VAVDQAARLAESGGASGLIICTAALLGSARLSEAIAGHQEQKPVKLGENR